MTDTADKPFWQTTALEDMSREEWESLCDGCGRCCLQKLEDEEGGIHYTHLACERLDCNTGHCSVYKTRSRDKPSCIHLKPEFIPRFHWLPNTCSYRLIHEGKDLPAWHPLVSGTSDTVDQAGISVKGRVISSDKVPFRQWQEHVIRWVKSCDPNDV